MAHYNDTPFIDAYMIKEYEKRIRKSTLFQLDKDTEYTAYSKEKYIMVENLFGYIVGISQNKEFYCKVQQYGYEVMKTIESCIKNYDMTKGDFLIYFKSAWKKQLHRCVARDELDNKYLEMHIKKIDKENLRRLKRWLKQSGHIDGKFSKSDIEKISIVMDMPVSEVEKLLILNQNGVVSDTFATEDGNELYLADDNNVDNSAEDMLGENWDMEEVFDRIDEKFIELQERQRPILSDLLTITFCESIVTKKINYGKYKFLNDAIVENFMKNCELPNQNWVAEKYNRNKASVSRTLSDFIEKIGGEKNG